MDAPDPKLHALRPLDALLLVLLLAVALAWPMHSPPIAAHGEAREGLVVQDMVQHGNWVLPRRNGALPSKPPLFHWIAAGVAQGFGLSDAVVRSPSALAAGVMLLATFGLGCALGGRAAGWFAAGALLGVHGFWASAWEARVDMVFAASVTLALVAFFHWYRRGGGGARAACYLAAACAVLAKGPAGAALPGLVIVAFIGRESWRAAGAATPPSGARGALAHALLTLRRLWSWPLVALVLLVDVGWYVLAYRRGGTEFLAFQLMQENVDRIVGRGVFGLHGGHARLKILKHLVTDLVPWNLVLVWAAIRWLRGVRADLGERFLHAWWIVIVAVFTAAYGKRDIYLLPAYPAIAILAGRALAAATANADATRLFGVVPIPERFRRGPGSLPARALLVLLVVILDVSLVTVSQVTRVHRARRRSLVAFTRVVERELSADAAVYAQGDVDGSDVQVVAYHLCRAVPTVPSVPVDAADAATTYYIVRAPADRAMDPRFHIVAQSDRRGPNVALVTIPR